MILFESDSQGHKIDNDRREYILSFVSYISGAIILFYGLRHLMLKNTSLALILLSASTAFLLTVGYYRWSKNIERACLIEALLVALFVLALVFHGGYANTALYWVFPFPAILFGLLGVRNAAIGNTLILVLLAIMLFVDGLIPAQYRPEETSRFFASVVIVVMVSWINDYFRERSHQKMDVLQATREKQANTDPLTLLPNRRFIDSHLGRDLAHRPEEFLPMGVVMCDIDHFKRLNDQFGHHTGDLVLKQVAEHFRKALRRQDIACRTGGEEFLLLLPKTDLNDARLVAEKVRDQLARQPFIIKEKEHPITASFGVTVCETADALASSVEQADELLYRSKQSGRNKVS
ncbi:GGDEF domain-containing protein [Marinimicrobium agarilyticum]|uniref:GGDEF domain-containing protein n=1 Tax=Marinimicrobium agarilyticum TaxID=306546 RepID=UPI000400D28D|nr:GGDEF domain-containing protein [Marinimicrobium agarilyticum]